MKSLHIRDVPPETIAALKRLARQHHRSLQGELRAILEQAARLATEDERGELNLHFVETGRDDNWRRDDMYDDSAR